MKPGNTSFHINALVVSATLLLIGGLAIDMFFVKPNLSSVKRLNNERLQLMQNNETNLTLGREIVQLKSLLKVATLEELGDLNSIDPIAYVGARLDETRLQRVEITTGETDIAGKLKRTKVSVRVRGQYNDIVSLVRMLEVGVRLVTLDDLDIEQLELDSRLEARLNMTVLDPVGGR